jgi:alpha-L-fucosidase
LPTITTTSITSTAPTNPGTPRWSVRKKKDIVGGWEKAVRAAGLRFAVSVHASHSWSWYEVSQGADKNGPLAGVPYDGHLTKADGKGLWWDGLDPQELYAQNHKPMGLEWEWNNKGQGDLPTAAYCEKFYRRTMDLIDKYHPDQVYFDDTILPLYPISDVGLRIAAGFYNRNMKRHGGRLEAVVNGKILNEQQRKCLVWDLERGYSDRIEPLPWQTDTCIGDWHYSLPLYERHGYKKPDQVAHMLVDIVSKNGNLMLNIPLPGNGMPDPDELAFLADFTKWMDVNSEGIHGTRPWHVFGEGPAGGGPATHAQGFNEGARRYTAQDFRFTQKGDTLYAFAMAWPANGKLVIRSLATGAGKVQDVKLLGHPGKLVWTQTAEGLVATMPNQKPCDYVYGLKIVGRGLVPVSIPPEIEKAAVVVQPQANGAIVLPATAATLHGDSPQLEAKGSTSNIGYWGSDTDYVSWDFLVPLPGNYDVSVNYACDTNAAGEGFRVEVGDHSVTGTTASTGNWDTFADRALTPLLLPAIGKQTLTFKPQAGTWKGLALRSVTLTKASDAL